MMNLNTSSNGGYPQEVFAIRNRGDDLGHHDDDYVNTHGPPALAAGNGQPHANTTPLALIRALIIKSLDHQ